MSTLQRDPDRCEFALPDVGATAALAERIAGVAKKGDVIGLKGALGSGKTTFARAFIRARGGRAEEVPSPTFTLVQVYEVDEVEVWHFDLYRVGGAEETYELGIEEAFAEGISLIEWPERLGALLPPDRLEILFEMAADPVPEARCAQLTGFGRWAARLAALERALPEAS